MTGVGGDYELFGVHIAIKFSVGTPCVPALDAFRTLATATDRADTDPLPHLKGSHACAELGYNAHGFVPAIASLLACATVRLHFTAAQGGDARSDDHFAWAGLGIWAVNQGDNTCA